ncbi:MAG TPA: hypothetical protein VFB62_25675 [Polyangiaceae bacterium]|nr:hypothetical protein [Polyangiaceae bacterium]
MRRRHEWLARPAKGKRVKRRGAKRIGLLEARERNEKSAPAEKQEPAANAEA